MKFYVTRPSAPAFIAAVKTNGADAWFERSAQDFLGPDYAAEDYEQVMDVLPGCLV